MPSSPRSTTIVNLLATLWMAIISLNSTAQSNPIHHCPNNTQIMAVPSTTYFSNLRSLLLFLSLSAVQSNGFLSTTISGVSGLYLCRGDTTPDICRDCVATAVIDIRRLCPNNSQAIVWYDECLLRYSNASFFGAVEPDIAVSMWNTQNNSQPDEPDIDARALMYGLAAQVPTSPLMYGTEELNGTEARYSMGQCSRDLDVANCYSCLTQLTTLMEHCCKGRVGWRLLNPSCFIRYESHPFYTPNSVRRPSNEGNGSSVKQTVITSVAVAFVVAVLLSCSIYYRLRRRKSHAQSSTVGFNAMNQEAAPHGLQHGTSTDFAHPYISMEGSDGSVFPLIPLTTIHLATNNFSDKHKLGQGGFGPVYKGDLPDGKQIAVKRLSTNSRQGHEEFKNEVTFIANLQHKNLVRLLGYCMEQNEKLLVYEYMSNASLDVHLFDPQRRAQLDWKRRLNIIYGIGKGLSYLHEDSRLKIIHRDLKASNILLDSRMNPKISDFGLARIFVEDQNEANTKRVMGTYGYMAPEYAMEGLFSVKSDVFSFGVLLLEIISGRRNSGFYLSKYGQSLLLYAWKLWCEGQALVLMDSTLMESYVTSEVLKCIHIGLLCVQEDAADRPTMSRVIAMLSSDTVTLPRPMQPAFSVGRMTQADPGSSGSGYGYEKGSINNVTVSSIVPR